MLSRTKAGLKPAATSSKFTHTAAFRLALLYAAIFGLSTFVLFAFTYFRVQAYGLDQMRASIGTELSALLEEERRAGEARLREEVAARGSSAESRSSFYLLQDARGVRLAGNIPPVPPVEGLFEMRVAPTHMGADAKQDTSLAMFRGAVLPSGGYLALGRNLGDLDDLNTLVLRAFLGSLAVTAILALAGGLLLGAGFVRRLEAINRTARTIVSGRLSERIPLQGSGDELDQLSDNLNTMLDRIQTLMESMRQVSSDVAHDLRTPLARLRQRLERMRQKAKEPAQQDDMEAALGEIDNILGTFSALLRIAQIETGSRRAGFRSYDLSDVFETVCDAYGAVAEDHAQRFESRIEPGVMHVGDRELMTQMLANLVENALRHSPPGAAVRVELARSEAGRPVGMVSDNGPGIPPDERDKVFRRFYRLERNRTTAGNGLGLSLVAAVAELHGLAVKLEDNAPGLRVRIRF
ncbi:sensor histidine kinase [Alsobacter sp. SYSU BS001988]